jgi:AcrR family transcriptional regulator
MEKGVEQKITDAARHVFYDKGYNGATMRDIAKTADVNLALLHYYFGTKDKIMEIVFNGAFSLLFRQLNKALSSDVTVFEKIKLIVTGYVQVGQKHPQLPGFVINELAVNPQRMMPILMKYKEQDNVVRLFDGFYIEIEEAAKNGLIKQVNPKELCADILSLSLFPFIAKNCLTELIYEDEKSYNQMIKQRIDSVTNIVICSIEI